MGGQFKLTAKLHLRYAPPEMKNSGHNQQANRAIYVIYIQAAAIAGVFFRWFRYDEASERSPVIGLAPR